ncbi:hypothetical protein KC878_00275 [Candidatus Saccharibacteria bacterium]|nr:hypothetical protein [Candidatus Saccharibacteria bacterium]MCB9821050.1 hypothetical protein [Candidatus Nomurabacteria bacterium]
MKLRILSLVAIVAVGFVLSWPVRAIGADVGVAREQAISHLSQLVDTYAIKLSTEERTDVLRVCRNLQATTIQTMSTDLPSLEQKYTQAVSNIDSTIKYTANALNNMSEDSSSLDLAGVHLARINEEFTAAVTIYSKALDELLVIDCQVFPEHFVAGLEEARFRRKLVLGSAESIVDFRDGELSNAFQTTLDKLKDIEANR